MLIWQLVYRSQYFGKKGEKQENDFINAYNNLYVDKYWRKNNVPAAAI